MNRRQFIAAAALAATPRPPNIVVLFADNLGYEDLGCYGSIIRTPNIDRMAAEGIRFRHAYSANPICSPSRAALLTGRYPPRAGVPGLFRPQSEDGLPPSEITIAQMLKAKNYRTACLGKWHLGHRPEYLPTTRGFDEYLGIPYSPDMTPLPFMRDTETIEEPAKLDAITARLTEKAVRFIEKSKDAPFFLYMPFVSPHPPQAASARFRGKSRAGIYGDMVEEMDWSAGEVLAALKRHKLDGNTLVIFTSDNGPMNLGNSGRLRGRISSTYEGGMREPFIARFPGRIPPNRVSDQIVSTMDILPTVARLCGAPLPDRTLDGIDLWPVLSGQRKEIERDVLLYFDNVHIQCARLGRYKLHISRYTSAGRVSLPLHPPELYDVVDDPGEGYYISPEHPQVVKEILERVEKLLPGLPEAVRKAYAETKARKTAPYQIGSPPRVG